MDKNEKKAIIEFIRSTFRALSNQFDNRDFKSFVSECFNAAKAEEKKHRSISKYGLTVDDAAMLFTVRNLAELLAPGYEKMPDLRDLLTKNLSFMTAAAAVIYYKAELTKFYAQDDRLAKGVALDYFAMIK